MESVESTNDPAAPSALGRLLHELRHRTLARGALYAFLLYTSSAGLGYLLQTALARLMSVEDYGAFTYVNTWSEVLAIPAGLGLATSALRFLPQYKAEGADSALRGFVKFASRLTLWMGLIGGVGMYAGAVAWLGQPSTLWMLGAMLLPVHALVALFMQMSRANGRVVLAFGPAMVLRHVLMFLAMGVLLGMGGRFSAASTMGILLGVMLLVLTVLAISFFWDMRAWNASGGSVAFPREWMWVSIPLLFANLSHIIASRSDLLMLGAYRGEAEVALYNAAYKTATLASFVLLAFNMVMAPRIATLYAERNIEALQRLVSRTTGVMFACSVVICAGLLLLGKPILSVFGPQYVAGYGVLVVMLIGQLFGSAFGTVTNLLNLTGHQNFCLLVLALGAGSNVALNLWAIPHYGLIGAAGAAALTSAAVSVALYVLVRRRLGVDPAFWRFSRA